MYMEKIECPGAVIIRRATAKDMRDLEVLAEVSMLTVEQRGYSDEQHEDMRRYAVMDPTLVDDGTYYVAEIAGRIVAGGGWSRRKGFCTQDNQNGEAQFADPSRDAARVRGMYTHPDFTRRGLGSALLTTVETAASDAGFQRAELLATPAGRMLYLRAGWQPIGQVLLSTEAGRFLPAVHMEKVLL